MAEKKEQAKATAKTTEKKSDTVKITVMAPRDEVRDGFTVYINGVPTYVPYNEEAEVPKSVAAAINDSNEALKKQRAYDDKVRA